MRAHPAPQPGGIAAAPFPPGQKGRQVLRTSPVREAAVLQIDASAFQNSNRPFCTFHTKGVMPGPMCRDQYQ